MSNKNQSRKKGYKAPCGPAKGRAGGKTSQVPQREPGSDDDSGMDDPGAYKLGMEFIIVRETPLRHIVRNIEMVRPLLPPVGCGPVAEANWLRLGTADAIVAMRDELQMSKSGWICGDRTWRRCKLRAEREIEKFEALSEAKQQECRNAKFKGIQDPKGRPPFIIQVGEKETDEIDRQPLSIIRSPKYAILKAFLPILDKCWHRFMFPMGCYILDRGVNNENSGEVWKDWAADMLQHQTGGTSYVNPYSVAAADILYLCNVRGYLDRLLYSLIVIEWAKERGVNLLIHRRARTNEDGSYNNWADLEDGISPAEQFISIEKHLHVFGCIKNHLEVLQNNYTNVGGFWDEKLKQLKKLYHSLQSQFHISQGYLDTDLDKFLVKEVNVQSKQDLLPVFKRCCNVGDRRP